MLAQNEIQLADFRDATLQGRVQNLAPKVRRERAMHVSDNARLQAVPAAGNSGDNGINAICGGAGHQPDEQLRLWIRHGRKVGKETPKTKHQTAGSKS
jgi:hypothetical protein